MVESQTLRSRNVYRKVPNTGNPHRFAAGKSSRRDIDETQKDSDSRGSKRHSDRKSHSSHRKSHSSRKEKKSHSSKKSKKKLEKGLSPPKDVPRPRQENSTGNSTADGGGASGEFDKTQWRLTRWAEETTNGGTGGARKMPSKRQRKSVAEPSKGDGSEPHGKMVPGEARQEEVVRGEHLKKKPVVVLVLLSIEAVMGLVSLVVWSAASDNPLWPLILAIVNLIVVFGLICAVFLVELCRFQVKSVEDGKTGRLQKLKIPYRWRFQLAAWHIARVVLICCNITLMALDNDFDPGTIAVLAMQPLHLLIVGVHLVIVFRPKAKQ